MSRLFKVGIYTGCLVLLIYLAFRLYIRDVTFLIPFILGLVFVCVSLLGLVIWLFVRPSFSKFREAAIPLLVVAVTVFFANVSFSVAWTLFLWPRQQELGSFARDLVEYGRITEMSDGQRYSKSLNGHIFDSSDRTLEPSHHPVLLKLLETNEIELDRYLDFRERLVSLRFIDVEVTDKYVAFLYGGMIDNLYGVLWVRPGFKPPALKSLVFGCTLVHLHERGKGWYLFATT